MRSGCTCRASPPRGKWRFGCCSSRLACPRTGRSHLPTWGGHICRLPGCRLALLEHAGAAQPFHAYAIDLASRARACTCLPRDVPAVGRARQAAAPLPGQHASHYMQCDEPGIGSLASSLFEQLKQRGALQPHLLVASFSLHYPKPAEKAAFFRRLAELATAPLLLVVIKGIGEVQQLCTKGLCRSVHFEHYVIGQTARRG